MGLPWIRLDTAFPRNPKLLALLASGGHRAGLVYVCGLAYAGEQGSDGFIPRYALQHIHGRPRDAAQLVDCKLWHEQRGGAGWTINDWADFQQSNSETAERARRARQAGRKANCTRWHEPGCMCWKADP